MSSLNLRRFEVLACGNLKLCLGPQKPRPTDDKVRQVLERVHAEEDGATACSSAGPVVAPSSPLPKEKGNPAPTAKSAKSAKPKASAARKVRKK